MKMVRITWVLLVACVAAAQVIKNADIPGRIESEYVVTLKPVIHSSLKQHVDDFVQRMAHFSDQISIITRHDFKTVSILHIHCNEEFVVTQLYRFSEVMSIEAHAFQKVLNDACLEQPVVYALWGLGRLTTRELLDDKTYLYQEGDGTGAYVYAIDSGIRFTHNEFGGRAVPGYTAPDIPEGDEDLNGHGTHCTGTAIGTTYGVAKWGNAISVKVIERSGIGSIPRTITALEWVLQDFLRRDEEAGGSFPAVISMPLAFPPTDAIDAIIQDMFDSGLPTITSAGNDAATACGQSPARAEASIAVMASGSNDRLSLYSNHGPCANIIAPGVSVDSAGIGDDDDHYTSGGTSSACAHVAGAVLRYMSQTIAETGQRPSPTEVRDWLISTSTKDAVDIRNWPDTVNYLLYAPCDVRSE